MKGDPLLSVEGRALHARKGEALTEDPSETPTVATGTPVPAGPADEVTAQDDALATEADSLTTKRRTARTKKRKARRSKRLGTDTAAATNSGSDGERQHHAHFGATRVTSTSRG